MIPPLEFLNHRGRSLLRGLCLRAITICLLASIVSVAVSLDQPWKPAWLFHVMQDAGWIDYETPPDPFPSVRSGLIWRVPPELTDAEASSPKRLRLGYRSSDGRRLVLEYLSSLPETIGAAGGIAALNTLQLKVTETDAMTGQIRFAATCVVNGELLSSGADVSEWLTAEDGLTGAQLQHLFELLRGLPAAAGYHRVGRIWIRSTVTPDRTFDGHRAHASVTYREPSFGDCQYETDAWFADESPGSVVFWQTTVTRQSTGQVITTTTWAADRY